MTTAEAGRGGSTSSQMGKGGKAAAATKDLHTAIAKQMKNAWVFAKAMTKAEQALRVAARVSRAACETFQDNYLHRVYKGSPFTKG